MKDDDDEYNLTKFNLKRGLCDYSHAIIACTFSCFLSSVFIYHPDIQTSISCSLVY